MNIWADKKKNEILIRFDLVFNFGTENRSELISFCKKKKKKKKNIGFQLIFFGIFQLGSIINTPNTNIFYQNQSPYFNPTIEPNTTLSSYFSPLATIVSSSPHICLHHC